MAVRTGTIIHAPIFEGLNKVTRAKVVFSLGQALNTDDTYEVDNLFPTDVYDVIIESGRVFCPRLDTNASPTATFAIGDSDDDDGLLVTKGATVALVNSLVNQVNYEFDGALIKNKTTITGKKLILTPKANPTTGVTTGDIFIDVYLRMISKTVKG